MQCIMIVCTIEMCHYDPLCNNVIIMSHCFICVICFICFIYGSSIFLVLCDALRCVPRWQPEGPEVLAWLRMVLQSWAHKPNIGTTRPGRSRSMRHHMRSTYSDYLRCWIFTKSQSHFHFAYNKVWRLLQSMAMKIEKMWKNMNNLAVEIGRDRLSLVRSRSHMSIPTCLRLGSQESTGRNGCRTGYCFYISRFFIRKWGCVPDWSINDS